MNCNRDGETESADASLCLLQLTAAWRPAASDCEIMTLSQMCGAPDGKEAERMTAGLIMAAGLGGEDFPLGLLVRYSCSDFGQLT